MIEVKILKKYQEYNKGDIVAVSNNIAFGLVDSGIARYLKKTKDFSKKIENFPEAETKAFGKFPSRKKIRRKKISNDKVIY